MRTLVLILLFASQVAQSQQPVPTPVVDAQVKQKEATANQQRAARDKRGTKEQPLVIDIFPAKKTAEDADRETQDRNDKAQNERVARIGIWANIILSILLVVANGALFIYTAKAANAARDAANYAGKSATPLLMPYI